MDTSDINKIDCNNSNMTNHDDSASTTIDILNETEIAEHNQLPTVNPQYDGPNSTMKRRPSYNYRKMLLCIAGSILVTVVLICIFVGITVHHRLNDRSPTYLRPKPHVTTTAGKTTYTPTTTPKISPTDVACHFLGFTEIRECLLTKEYDGDSVTNALLNTIPTEIGALKQLQKLSFNRDIHMTGTLPTELGMLTQLTLLSVTGVGLKGTIPETIGQLSLLQTLRLDRNAFTGTIPATFGALSNLHEVDVSYNELTGTIPSETFGNWTKVHDVWLNMNRLLGPIPSTIGYMKYCNSLILSDNHLTGSIPTSIGNMTELQVLMVYNNNQLTGGIPNSMTSLEYLSRVWFTNNTQMNGIIPNTIRNMNVNDIDFTNTKLHGTIPNALCRRFPQNAVHYKIDCASTSNTATTNPISDTKIYCNCCIDPSERICPNSTFILK